MRTHATLESATLGARREKPDVPMPDGLGPPADLKDANEKLLVAALREHENADRAGRLATELRAALRREALLSQVSLTLAGALNPDVLVRLPRLLVPELADWCAIETMDAQGTPEQLAMAHVTTEHACPLLRTAAELDQRLAGGAIRAAVLAYGQAVLRDDVPAGDRAARRRRRDVRSCLCAPIVVRGEVLGLLWAATSGSGRRLGTIELEFAKQVALRAALTLDNARLYEEARRAARLRDDVLATVSHDLGGLVAGIKLRADATLNRPGGLTAEHGRNALKLIAETAERMRYLVIELSDLASVQAGRLVLRRRALDARTLIEKSCEMAEPVAAAKSLRLTRSLPSQPLQVCCDAERVFRVLGNLLGNAIKFTPAGGTIRISTERRDPAIVVTVSDQGPGIPPDQIAEIFQPYRRGADVAVPGKGLGLYISRALVEAHGGALTVDSAPGKGSTFRFTLPVEGDAGTRTA